MDTPRKMLEYVKRSFSTLSSFIRPGESGTAVESFMEKADSSLKWSAENETMVIKKSEYEGMQTELFNKTEVIKKFKAKESDYQSLIKEYESTILETLKSENPQNISVLDTKLNVIERYEDELSKLRASENRLKSHIQALKRDLLMTERKAENIEDTLEQRIVFLNTECESIKNELRQEKLIRNKLEFENKEIKDDLVRRCEELAELIEYCRYLAK